MGDNTTAPAWGYAVRGWSGQSRAGPRRARSRLLSRPWSAIKRSDRLREHTGVPGWPTTTVSRVYSRSVTSAGDAASRYAPNEYPPH